MGSRRIEQAREERVDFMAVTGMEKPDHSTICKFRNDHRDRLAGLFVQALDGVPEDKAQSNFTDPERLIREFRPKSLLK